VGFGSKALQRARGFEEELRAELQRLDEAARVVTPQAPCLGVPAVAREPPAALTVSAQAAQAAQAERQQHAEIAESWKASEERQARPVNSWQPRLGTSASLSPSRSGHFFL